jgi:TPP-dependent trihydroxycyclohexane-1,2-dione (THcHDO) dehydratase
MLAPTAVEEVAGAAVGETLSTVTPETMAEFSSAFEQIMGDTAVDFARVYSRHS